MEYLEVLLTGLAGPIFAVAVLPWVIAIYFIFRYRSAQEGQRDPHIGGKTALHIFFSIGVLMVLGGITGLTVDLLTDPGEGQGGASALTRSSAAFVVSGLIISACGFAALRRATNDVAYPMVGRLFIGLRFALSALIAFSAMTMWFQIWFAEGDSGEVGRTMFGVMVVWLVSTGVHFRMLLESMGIANEPDIEAA